MSDGALILYSNTGRRLQFDARDIVMPAARFAALKQARREDGEGDDEHHDGCAEEEGVKDASGGEHRVSQWFVKQWDAMKGFYMTRLWKDESLQKLSLEEFTDRIADAVVRRWEGQRAKQREMKKRKRQQERAKVQQVEASKGSESSSPPSRVMVITNFVVLEEFAQMSLMARGALLEAVGVMVSQHGAIDGSDILADETAPPPQPEASSEPSASRGLRTEGGDASAAAPLDDRLAVRVAYTNPANAVAAVAKLNGTVFPLTQRPLLCELIPMEALAPQQVTAPQPRSFMDEMDDEIAALEDGKAGGEGTSEGSSLA